MLWSRQLYSAHFKSKNGLNRITANLTHRDFSVRYPELRWVVFRGSPFLTPVISAHEAFGLKSIAHSFVVRSIMWKLFFYRDYITFITEKCKHTKVAWN